jgi:predicted HicB family RNase H-like nuclease
MKDVLAYKDCIGSVHYNAVDEVFYGKIEGIEDLISFEGNSVERLKKSFEESVDDYLKICALKNKTIERSYKGSFNIRMSPDLHRKVRRKAMMLGLSLNQFIQKAVEDELKA